MTSNSYTLPLAYAHAFSLQNSPASELSPPSSSADADGSNFAQVMKNAGKLLHHHEHGSTASNGADSSSLSTGWDTDAFGVTPASSSSTATTDAFGVPSATKSSNSPLVSALSDPFSAIASNAQIQAQLQMLPYDL
jgi:hypothetical protein